MKPKFDPRTKLTHVMFGILSTTPIINNLLTRPNQLLTRPNQLLTKHSQTKPTQPNFRINKFDQIPQNSPNSLHIFTTTLKTFTEKLRRRWTRWRSGRTTISVLCMGVNSSRQSACTPYWSSVDFVRDNQRHFAGQKRPWSDQSVWTTEINKN